MYALYNICIKKGSNSIHPVLGGVILQFVAALLGSVLLGILIWKQGGYEDMPCDLEGVSWAVGAGAAVGAAEILSFIVSGMGVQAMQSIPIIIGGSVLFGTTLGFTVLKESLSCRGWSGVFLIAVGITLVGIDPGMYVLTESLVEYGYIWFPFAFGFFLTAFLLYFFHTGGAGSVH
jgi:transporter family protein